MVIAPLYNVKPNKMYKMKKFSMMLLLMFVGLTTMMAQTKEDKKAEAEISFEQTTHDFGTFSENDPQVTCVFKFKNTGNAPLIIHQAVASCGCTAPSYTKEPIKPGASGEIKVVYNGAGRFPGKFRKTVTIHSNAVNNVARIYIKGNMTAKDIDLQKAIEETKGE